MGWLPEHIIVENSLRSLISRGQVEGQTAEVPPPRKVDQNTSILIVRLMFAELA